MEETHSGDVKSSFSYDIDSDEDDIQLIQQLIGEHEGSSPAAGSIKSEPLKAECHQHSSLNDHLREDTKYERAHFSADSSRRYCRFYTDKYLYEDILDSFTELDEFSKSMHTHESTPAGEPDHCLSQLNEEIIRNLQQCRDLTTDAENIMLEKLNLHRELALIDQQLNPFTRNDNRLKELELEEAQKRKGTSCTFTGHSAPHSFFCRFGIPYFKTTDRFTPGPNADTKQIVRNNEIMLIRLPVFKKFTERHRHRLEEAVLTQLKTERLRELRALKDDKKRTASQKEKLVREINRVKSIKSIQDATDLEMPINFSTLCLKTGSSFEFKYSSEECERIWQLLGDPRISKQDFSADEMNRLEELVREHGAQDWDRLATLLDTKRSGFVCFVQWARSLSGSTGHQVWTSEESDKLFSLCRKLEHVKDRAVKTIIWRHIRRQFPHRTYSQLNGRWMYVLKPDLSKGRFTKKESNVLHHLRHEGKSYQEISSIIQTRSTVQLRAHYERAGVQGRYNCGIWTNEEETKLASLIRKHGVGNWKKISDELGTRNRAQCRLKAQHSSTWSALERRKFKKLFNRHGTDFGKISAEIGTKTAGQCRYMYRYMSVHRTGRWSPAEIASFRSLTDKWKDDFNLISRKLGTRSVDQCRAMYERMKQWGETKRSEPNSDLASRDADKKVGRRNMPPVLEIGRWSNKEISQFCALVKKWKYNFHAISREMGTKTADQCHQKYRWLKKIRNKKSPNSSSRRKKETEVFRKSAFEGKRDLEALSTEVGTENADQCGHQKYQLRTRPKNTKSPEPHGQSNEPRHLVDEPRCDFDTSSQKLGNKNVGPRFRKCEKMNERKLTESNRRLRSQTATTTTKNEEAIVSKAQKRKFTRHDRKIAKN